MRWLVDEAYHDIAVVRMVRMVRMVLDHLNPHRMASLYETFPVVRGPADRSLTGVSLHAQARQLAQHSLLRRRLGAEIEFSVLAWACLKGRNSSKAALQESIGVYAAECNGAAAIINWRLTTKDARAKLRRLYPSTPALTQY